jgi:hypothetical protein
VLLCLEAKRAMQRCEALAWGHPTASSVSTHPRLAARRVTTWGAVPPKWCGASRRTHLLHRHPAPSMLSRPPLKLSSPHRRSTAMVILSTARLPQRTNITRLPHWLMLTRPPSMGILLLSTATPLTRLTLPLTRAATCVGPYALSMIRFRPRTSQLAPAVLNLASLWTPWRHCGSCVTGDRCCV